MCPPGVPLWGAFPVLLVMVDGLVDVKGLRDGGPLGRELHAAFGNPSTMSLLDLLRGAHNAGKAGEVLFRQLVWHFASLVETAMLGLDDGGAAEKKKDELAEVDVGSDAVERKSSLWPRLGKLARSLTHAFSKEVQQLKYYYCSRRVFAKPSHISVTLDALRLNRRNVLLGLMALPSNVAAWLPPQVFEDKA